MLIICRSKMVKFLLGWIKQATCNLQDENVDIETLLSFCKFSISFWKPKFSEKDYGTENAEKERLLMTCWKLTEHISWTRVIETKEGILRVTSVWHMLINIYSKFN